MNAWKLAVLAILSIGALAACGSSGSTPTASRAAIASATPGGGTTPAPTAAATAVVTAAPAGGAATAAPAGGTIPTAAPTTAPAGAVDLCSLLSPADFKTVTGKDYGAGVLDPAGQCNWNTDASGVNSGELIVAALQTVDLPFIKSSFVGGVDVTVGGHPAYWNPTIGLQSMWVDVGGGNVLVLSFPTSRTLGPDDQVIAQKLAEIAVGKM